MVDKNVDIEVTSSDGCHVRIKGTVKNISPFDRDPITFTGTVTIRPGGSCKTNADLKFKKARRGRGKGKKGKALLVDFADDVSKLSKVSWYGGDTNVTKLLNSRACSRIVSDVLRSAAVANIRTKVGR
jgi:hypothetical protein